MSETKEQNIIEPRLTVRDEGGDGDFTPSPTLARKLRDEAHVALTAELVDLSVHQNREDITWDETHEIERSLSRALDAVRVIRACTAAPKDFSDA